MTKQTFLDFIEIGTSDFNTEIQKNDTKIGLSIDAVKFYIDRLPDKKGCIKINNGISNFNGNITINYLDEETIIKYDLPYFLKGCNSVNDYHPNVTGRLLNIGVDPKDVVISNVVPCKTLINILHEYNIQGLYFLKVDTEGHDSVILEHFFNNFNDNNFLPHKILFESNRLTNPNDTKKIIRLLETVGYDLISSNNDTLLKLNLKQVKKRGKFSNEIANYYIEEYPKDYNPENLPHKNTLEDATKYCIENKCSGITYQNNRYEVRSGKYINYYNDKKILSWLFL